MKRREIEANVRGFAGELESIVSSLKTLLKTSIIGSCQLGRISGPSQFPALQSTPAPSLGHEFSPSDSGSGRWSPWRERSVGDTSSAMTVASSNAGTFTSSTNDVDGDPGSSIFRITNGYRPAEPRDTGHQRLVQSRPLNHPLSNGWTGRSQD